MFSPGEPPSDDKRLQIAYAVDAIKNIVTPSLDADGLVDAGDGIAPAQLAPIQDALKGALEMWAPATDAGAEGGEKVNSKMEATKVQALSSYAEICQRLVNAEQEASPFTHDL